MGRQREVAEARRLLAAAANGTGGLVVFAGPTGSGRTAVADAVVAAAGVPGSRCCVPAPAPGQPGRLVWAQLLRDAGTAERIAAVLLGDPTPLDLDTAARVLAPTARHGAHPRPGAGDIGWRRLIILDDLDRGGPDAVGLLSILAARLRASSTAVVVTAVASLGVGTTVFLRPLDEAQLATAMGIGREHADLRRALWLASGGLPGAARPLVDVLGELPDGRDPVVHLALAARTAALFLAVDANLLRLLETAVARPSEPRDRARVAAKLARELLWDATAGPRRRALADEAVALARRIGEPALLAEVLDARLHALWDASGAGDCLAAASEIIDLARVAGEGERERSGLFWRFTALMELGRVGEAESALAAYHRMAEAAGDDAAMVMATARYAMLAILRGVSQRPSGWPSRWTSRRTA